MSQLSEEKCEINGSVRKQIVYDMIQSIHFYSPAACLEYIYFIIIV